MMKFAFVVGLTLRHGTRTLELVRQLSDDEYQFEDVETRRPRTFKKFRLLKDIESGKYSVILPWTGGKNKLPEPQTFSASALPEAVQKEIDRRYAYIIGMSKSGVTPGNRRLAPDVIKAVAAKIKDPEPPATSTLLLWARKFERSGRNPRALASGNYGRKSPKRKHELLHKLILKKIGTEYLTEDRNSLEHTSIVICSEAEKLVAEGKLDPNQAHVSTSTVARYVRELDRYTVISRRYGHARARLLCRTPMHDDPPEYPFELVEVDHTPLDWIVICDRTGLPLGRPLLTATICAATGYPAGIYLSFYGPGLTSVSGVLLSTIRTKDEICLIADTEMQWLSSGIPDGLQLDNGLEFHALTFKRMGREAEMDVHFARVRTPWSKPHIERFFSTLGFLTLATGRIRKHLQNVLCVDPRTTATITFSKLVIGLTRYVVDVYPKQINERKLARPYDLMAEGIQKCPPANYLTSTESIRQITALSKTLTVSQGGVELLGIPYGGAELLPMRKATARSIKTLVKWDPDDINQIWVQHPITLDWVISASRWPHYTRGLSWNQHLIIRKFMREELKLKGAEEDNRRSYIRLHDFWMDATCQKSAANAKLAAQFSGMTSARVFTPPETSIWVPPSEPIGKSEEQPVPAAKREIPDFESFDMR